MGEFKAITTQEDLDKIVVDRLKRQKEGYEAKLKEYEEAIEKNKGLKEELKTANDRLKDLTEKENAFNGTIAGLQDEISKYKLEDLKTSIALKCGLPYELSSRLSGQNEEELIKDAENLAGYVNATQGAMPLRDVEEGVPTGAGNNSSFRSILNNLNLQGD